MATGIQVGQRVRINEKYAKISEPKANVIGTEFTVTNVEHAQGTRPQGHWSAQIISGDPMGWGIWGDFVDVVPCKATTIINTTIGTPPLDRMVRIGSGARNVLLSVTGGPGWQGHGGGGGRIDGTTSLTLEQAEEIAHDLLARVAEIRGTQ